jgi:tetratricopeptide (TPR) repeat protein
MMLAQVAGDVAYAEGRYDAAVAIWSQHLPPIALIYKAETVLAHGDSQTAIALLTGIPEQRYPQPAGGRLAGVLVELGNATLDGSNFVDAESYWRWALIQSPGRDNYYVGLGRALAGQQRWDEAAAAYQAAIRLAPDKAQHYVRLARALMQMGEADQAILALRRAVDLEPDNAAALRLLDQHEPD